MSNGQVVRQPLAVRERSSRTLDQRLALRFPRLASTLAAQIFRLPPRSRLRQTAVLRGVRLGVEAYNRRDLDAYLAGFHRECELRPPREFIEAGFAEQCYRGSEGVREYMSIWFEIFGADIRVEPVELIDAGDRLVMLGHVPARAQASGVPLSGEIAIVTTVKDGRSRYEQHHFHHAGGLQAVDCGSRTATNVA